MFREGQEGKIKIFQCFDCHPVFHLAKAPFMLRKQMTQQLRSPPGWILKPTVLRMGFRTCKLPPAPPAGCGPSEAPEWLWLHTHLPLPVAPQAPHGKRLPWCSLL